MGAKLRDRTRATTHRVLEIARAARSRGQDVRQRREGGYRRLLATVRSAVRDAARVGKELGSGTRQVAGGRGRLIVTRAQVQLEHLLPLVHRVIAQTRARVFKDDTHYRDKVLSLFEPYTEAIRKGKASKPTEFGKLVKIQEAENQIVVDYQVFEKRPEDRTLVAPSIDAHRRVFGQAPQLLAADRGFWSPANQRAAKQTGVKRVCIPALGRPGPEQAHQQRQRWFRRGQRFRTGCEGRISLLKRRDGLRCCRYRGINGIKRWVGWGVVNNNLWVMITAKRP